MTRDRRAVPAPREVASCRAPWVTLRLAPGGVVQACCVNEDHELGRIGEDSLTDIWWGERADALRSALAADDLSLGCHGCAEPIAAGRREQSLAADYDHFPLTDSLTWPVHLELALSNTCNLQCQQCNGELSSAIRAQREHRPPLDSPYDDAFFAELAEFVPHLRAATFIGGEPFLAREARRAWDLLLGLEHPPPVWVTTNGTVWDERVEHYLRALRMGVSVSIDGVRPETIASLRVGADPDVLLANRDRFLAATRSYGSDFKLNFCVMPQNWAELLPFLIEADRLDVPVYVARVQQPASHSLFDLPTEALREVVAALRAEERGPAARLGRNRAVWDRTVAELADHLATVERAGTPVVVARPRRSRRRAEAELDRLTVVLAEQGGGPPARLVVRGRRIAEVDVPAWAAFLGLDGCVGVEQDRLLDAVGNHVGAPIRPEPVADEAELFGVEFTVHDGVRAVRVHSVSVHVGGSTVVLVGRVRA